MSNVYFENQWYKRIESFDSELKKYETELAIAKIEFPEKVSIQSYYSDQIKGLNTILSTAGYSISTNLASLRMKFMQEYSKINLNSDAIADDGMIMGHAYYQLVHFCETLRDELSELEDLIEIIGYDQTKIENALSDYESSFDNQGTTMNKIFEQIKCEDFIMEARKNVWEDTLSSISSRVLEEVKIQNFQRNPKEITTMYVDEDLYCEFEIHAKNFNLSPFINLIDDIASEVRKEIREIELDEKVDQVFKARSFIDECDIDEVLLTVLKRDKLIKSSDERFTVINKPLNFIEHVRNKEKLNKIIIHLLKTGIISEDKSIYRWNGIGKNKVESLMDFSRVLEEENIVKHIGSYKDIFLTYNSYFNTYLKNGVRQAQEVYDQQNEIRFRNEFSFVKSIK
tara:strand:+ start:7124 stop:8317 length:1194 start_codon:yes stop_codon:yes gene_type:complete